MEKMSLGMAVFILSLFLRDGVIGIAPNTVYAMFLRCDLLSSDDDKSCVENNTIYFIELSTSPYLRLTDELFHTSSATTGDNTRAIPSKTAYSPASPDDLATPMDVLEVDAPRCGQDCFGNDSCMSFAYDAAKGQCMKYGGNYFGNFPNISEKRYPMDIPLYARPMYFFNLSHALDRGYIMDRKAGLCYKVVIGNVSHDEAEVACSIDKARLMAIQSTTQLNAVLDHINSTVAESNFPLHVAGSGPKMTYFNTQPIPETLFSVNGTTALGNCTQLTSTGLSNGFCLDTLSFVCAY